MKKIFTLFLFSIATISFAQTVIQNGGFETWDNAGASNEEPTFYNSNKTGTDWAPNGPQTCYRDASVVHSGTYSARVETKTYVFAVVNGSLTTGIVNAPTTSKSDGYIGTMKNTDISDIRRMAFSGRPDSLIGFYKYTQGGAAEKGKVVAYLHKGHYYDPEAATSYHPDSSANKIATALFLTPTANVNVWTRFSVPFTYLDSRTPQYIMINMTSSNDQLTTVAGSKIWLDDISVVYNPTTSVSEVENTQSVNVYCYDKTAYVNFYNKNSNNQYTMNIYDVTGKIVATQKVDANKSNTINLSSFTTGLYIYQVTGADFNKSGKITVQ